jgi:Lon protease-like protein
MDWVPKRPVPVFPLPGVVLFPHAEMRLHVFELRYRTMVRDALSAERVIALATLAPGWEQDYHGSPPFHDLGCVARIEEVEWLPNDRYELRVRGLLRVHFGRVRREFPYRACDVDPLDDAPYSETDPLAELARDGLLAERTRLAPLGSEAWLSPPTLADGATLAEVAGVIATSVRLPAEDKLALLAEDRLPERARLLREQLRRIGPGSPQPPPPPDLSPN